MAQESKKYLVLEGRLQVDTTYQALRNYGLNSEVANKLESMLIKHDSIPHSADGYPIMEVRLSGDDVFVADIQMNLELFAEDPAAELESRQAARSLLELVQKY